MSARFEELDLKRKRMIKGAVIAGVAVLVVVAVVVYIQMQGLSGANPEDRQEIILEIAKKCDVNDVDLRFVGYVSGSRRQEISSDEPDVGLSIIKDSSNYTYIYDDDGDIQCQLFIPGTVGTRFEENVIWSI